MQVLMDESLSKRLIEREQDQGCVAYPYENIEQETFEQNRDLKTSFYLERFRFGNQILILMTLFSCVNAILYVYN